MKRMADHPEELRAWRKRALAERRAVLKRIKAGEDIDELDMPYIPSKFTIQFTYEEWRRIYQGIGAAAHNV